MPGTPQRKNGYIEQGNYFITWCYGHLLTLKEPEDYGEEYARQNITMDDLPIFFDNWELKVSEGGPALLKDGRKPPDKGEQVATIGVLLKKANSVIIAGDCDDEGQLLVEELLEWHSYKGEIKRLDTSALNEASLKKAMANLQDNDEWHLRALSARARSVSDFAHGINCSRFFSMLYGANLSIGRVQTAALGLVVNRDMQIENHTIQKYYLLDMDMTLSNGQPAGPHTVRFYPNAESDFLIDGHVENKAVLENIGNKVSGKEFSGIVTKEAVKEAAPLPFSISALKTYCSDKFNMAPEDVLAATQALRMKYGGLITYNRSECRYLPTNMHGDAPDIIAAIQQNLGGWAFPGLNPAIKSRAFNDTNTGVHHAIIPTGQTANMNELTDNELKVYKAICGYYMIQFMPSCEKERTRLLVNGSNGNKFEATSIKILSPGFKAVIKSGEAEPQDALSDVPEGEYKGILDNPIISEKETKPPRRYTGASLEEDMKSVAKYVTDPEAKKLLLLKDKDTKEEHGSIGTAATRSMIIATLKKRGFLEDKGKQIISTQLGREFYNILPDEIRKPDLTARWWAVQQAIQDGEASPEVLYKDVLSQFNKVAAKDYPKIDMSSFRSSYTKDPVGICPRCGKPVVEGKKGFGCSGYKEGCSFCIWKEGKFGAHKVLAASKKKITKTMAKKLLSDGKVFVDGLVSEKTGKTYGANITMNDTGNGVFLNLSFDELPKKRKKKGTK